MVTRKGCTDGTKAALKLRKTELLNLAYTLVDLLLLSSTKGHLLLDGSNIVKHLLLDGLGLENVLLLET